MKKATESGIVTVSESGTDYHFAACECGWNGSKRSTEEAAFEDFTEHHFSVHVCPHGIQEDDEEGCRKCREKAERQREADANFEYYNNPNSPFNILLDMKSEEAPDGD